VTLEAKASQCNKLSFFWGKFLPNGGFFLLMEKQ
jgi:hypothetical protein